MSRKLKMFPALIRRPSVLIAAAALVLGVILMPTPSHKHNGSAAVGPQMVHAATVPTPTQTVDINKIKPNEAGVVPILMYHNVIGGTIHGMFYPVGMFRNDLQWLYDHDYRPISLSRYARGYVDCPAGKSPVILTFDDGDRSQLNYLPGGKMDPNCAVAIMNDFHAKNPDWLPRATFFVIAQAPIPFSQHKWVKSKLQYLVKQGYEIGNHTVHHPFMNRLTDVDAEEEIAGCVTAIHKYVPGYIVDTLALPYGVFPKNAQLVRSGSVGGQSYSNVCAMAAGWAPAPSPISKSFHPYYLGRIQAGDKTFESHWWLRFLEGHKSRKFVSDGDPDVYTVNRALVARVDKNRIEALGMKLRLYGSPEAAKPSSAKLAVGTSAKSSPGHPAAAAKKHLTLAKTGGYIKPHN